MHTIHYMPYAIDKMPWHNMPRVVKYKGLHTIVISGKIHVRTCGV